MNTNSLKIQKIQNSKNDIFHQVVIISYGKICIVSIFTIQYYITQSDPY